MQAGQKEAVLSLIEQVEATNPLEAPTQHLEQCQGSWRLLFSTVTILVHPKVLPATKGMHSLSMRWPPVTKLVIWGHEDYIKKGYAGPQENQAGPQGSRQCWRADTAHRRSNTTYGVMHLLHSRDQLLEYIGALVMFVILPSLQNGTLRSDFGACRRTSLTLTSCSLVDLEVP